MQKSSFLYRRLASPLLYLGLQRLLGAARARRVCVEEYLHPRDGQRLLDIGCGPGYVLDYLPAMEYVGFDTECHYIDYARRRYGARGMFHCRPYSVEEWMGRFDRIVLFGLLHHLDDEQARDCLDLCRRSLNPGGKVVTLDGCYRHGQAWLARKLLDWDRGEHVRDEAGYRRLVTDAFSTVVTSVRQDLLLIPSTLLVMELSND